LFPTTRKRNVSRTETLLGEASWVDSAKRRYIAGDPETEFARAVDAKNWGGKC